MVGDYISTSYGSDNLAHCVFTTASVATANSIATDDGSSARYTGLLSKVAVRRRRGGISPRASGQSPCCQAKHVEHT
jgi:hypothetical protein